MKSKKAGLGFTIIETLVVLAIAALIILAIFLVVGPAHRSERDTQRKDGALKLVADLRTYATDHGNNLSGFSCPTDCTKINDPDSPSGHPNPGSVGVTATSSSGIIYVIGASCGSAADSGKAISSTSMNYAILYWSEANSSSNCLSNSGKVSSSPPGAIGGGGGGGGGALSTKGGTYSQCQPDPSRCLGYSGGAAYTAWAPTEFDYDTSLSAGTATLRLDYKNTGPLPDTYSAFKINVYLDGVKVASDLSLPVQPDGYPPGPFVTSFSAPSAATKIGIQWTNDWCCGMTAGGVREDANFVLLSLNVSQ